MRSAAGMIFENTISRHTSPRPRRRIAAVDLRCRRAHLPVEGLTVVLTDEGWEQAVVKIKSEYGYEVHAYILHSVFNLLYGISSVHFIGQMELRFKIILLLSHQI